MSLRSRTIRLAHEHPALRSLLLPLLRTARKPIQLPEGTEVVEAGKFKVYVTPANAKFKDAAMAMLDWADREYTQAGFPLVGPVQVVLGGRSGTTRSAFYSQQNAIALVPAALRSGKKDSFIHELAHWYHYNRVQGSYGNTAISSKFWEAMGEKRTHVPEKADAIVTLNRLRKEYEVLKDLAEKAALKGLARGATYEREERENPFKQGEMVTRKFKVTGVSGKKVKVTILNPTPWDLGPHSGGVVREDLARNVAYRLQSQADRDASTAADEAMNAKAKELTDHIKAGDVAKARDEQHESRYDQVNSEWVPTDYSRTNVLEWWAELMTMRILQPGSLTDAVKAWMKSV